MSNELPDVIAYIPASAVEYSLDNAKVEINELIFALEELRNNDGVTHLVGLSGNYRGAKYIRLGQPEVDDEDWNGGY